MEVTKGLTIGTYIGGAALAVGGVFMPLLWIPAAAALSTSVGTAIAHKSYKDQGEVDVNEIRNRLQNQRREKERLEEKNESLRRDLINDQRKISDLYKKLDVCEDSIGDYRKSIAAMAFCKKILTEWLLFLQDLEQSMDRVDSYGSSYATIKDTSAFHDYLTFIEGSQANQILDTSTKMQALEYMDEYELNQMIMWHENYSSDVEDTSNFNYTGSFDDDEDHYNSISVDETDSSDSPSHCDSSNDENECSKTSDSDGSTDSEDNENDCNNENDTDDFDNSDDLEDYNENNDSDDEFY
uniref:Uncharacterized protein n=1 Tax=Panagrolaimus davidi TaxID=227884 RepID=A0A914QIA9_9BILA